MDVGILVTATATITAAWLALRGVLAKGKTDSRAVELDLAITEMRQQIAGLKADVADLKKDLAATATERDALRTERDALRGRVRDQDELLDDWRLIGDWIAGGAAPPTPSLSWRILQERTDHERALARQRTTPTTSQED